MRSVGNDASHSYLTLSHGNEAVLVLLEALAEGVQSKCCSYLLDI